MIPASGAVGKVGVYHRALVGCQMIEIIRITEATVKGKPALIAKLLPGGEIYSYMKLSLELPVSYREYLLIAGSADFGLTLDITPIRQPLPLEDREVLNGS